MQVDQGAVIGAQGYVSAPSNGAYAFGGGDFSVAALFQTTHGGTIVSKKSAAGGSSIHAGWLVVVKSDGTIKFATDNGYGFYEVNSVPTRALDGGWHHVAAVREQGALKLYFDGAPLAATPRSSLPTPLDVTGTSRLVIGATDQWQEPFNQFVGTVEDVVLFSRAIAQSELPACMFNLLTGAEPGLVGLFRMNGNGTDDSPVHNHASQSGNVYFTPVYHSVWTDGDNAFSYLSITSLDGIPTPGPPAPSARLIAPGPVITRAQSITISPGTPFLAACITDDAGLFSFPSGASVTITDPTGHSYDQDVDSPTLFVKTAGGRSPWVLVVASPSAGRWTASVTAPSGVNFAFGMVALPSDDVMAAIERGMAPILPPPPSSLQAAMPRAAEGGSYWGYFAAAALGAVGGAIAVTTGAVTLPAAVLGLAAYNAALSIGLATQMVNDIQQSAPTPPIAADQAAQYMAAGRGHGPPALAKVVQAIRNKVGVPSTTDPARFASRGDMGVDASYFVHLDIGGEGYHEVFGVYSGFRGAINLNAQTTDSQPPYGPIPMLVQVPSWSTSPPYPFADGIADYVTMQGAPLTAKNVSEIARLVRPGGRVGLWIDREHFQGAIDELASILRCTPTYSSDPGSGCSDEFAGNAGYPKVCLVNNRSSS